MSPKYRLVVLIVVLAALALTSVPAAAAQGSVQATLLDSSTKTHVVLNVSADGVYKINVEGNNPADVITATATNSKLEFDLGNKTSWQIQNVVPTNNCKTWTLISPDGWFGLSTPSAQTVTPAPATTLWVDNSRDRWQDYFAKHQDCDYWRRTGPNEWTWDAPSGLDICQSDFWLQFSREGDKFLFTLDKPTEVDAVWGRINDVEMFNGLHKKVTLQPGSYTYQDTSEAFNSGFRAHVSQTGQSAPASQQVAPTVPPAGQDTQRAAFEQPTPVPGPADPAPAARSRYPWWYWLIVAIIVVLAVAGMISIIKWLINRRSRTTTSS